MNEPLQVACASDERFLPACAAMIHSLCSVHDPSTVNIHFLHDPELPRGELARLDRFVSGLGACWDPILVDEAMSSRFPDHIMFGRTAWYRVLLPSLLPGLSRVLYLDADTLVVGRLDELWSRDLSGYALAAVANPMYPEIPTDFLTDIGVPSMCEYFNSGVLLLNLAEWRKQGYTEAILEFAHRGIALDTYPDQNALNAVLWRHCDRVTPRWNLLTMYLDLKPEQLCYDVEEVLRARSDPAIVHFIGKYKPWHFRFKHPYHDTYLKHVEHTPWRDTKIEGRKLPHILLRPFPRLLGLRIEAWIRIFFGNLSRRIRGSK